MIEEHEIAKYPPDLQAEIRADIALALTAGHKSVTPSTYLTRRRRARLRSGGGGCEGAHAGGGARTETLKEAIMGTDEQRSRPDRKSGASARFPVLPGCSPFFVAGKA